MDEDRRQRLKRLRAIADAYLCHQTDLLEFGQQVRAARDRGDGEVSAAMERLEWRFLYLLHRHDQLRSAAREVQRETAECAQDGHPHHS